MICPVCKVPAIVVEQNQVELDYCARCHGVWFDAGELELLLDNIELGGHGLSHEGILNLPEVKTSEKKRRCPICSHNMKKVHIGHEPQVLIDACPQGHGLWFDKGEVSQLAHQLGKAGGTAAEKIASFLGDVFKADETPEQKKK